MNCFLSQLKVFLLCFVYFKLLQMSTVETCYILCFCITLQSVFSYCTSYYQIEGVRSFSSPCKSHLTNNFFWGHLWF
jgi:hypothetical protein